MYMYLHTNVYDHIYICMYIDIYRPLLSLMHIGPFLARVEADKWGFCLYDVNEVTYIYTNICIHGFICIHL